MIQKIIKQVKIIPNEVFIYLICVIVHFISPHLYVHFCTPASWKGLFMSQFMVISPQCQLIRWAFSFSGFVLDNIWIFIITNFIRKIIIMSNPFSITK